MKSNITAQDLKLKRWSAVLEEMEQAIERAMSIIHEREQAFEDYLRSHKPPEPSEVAWPYALEEISQHMQALQSIADRAADSVADVDVALAEGEESLRSWLSATENARAKLDQWLTGAIR